MARAHASVAVPPAFEGEVFAPRARLQRVSRDGAALSLRLFSDAPDDATRFVLGDAPRLALSPVPPRAAPFFEAHAASLAYDGEDDCVLGYPLVTFTHQGQRRAAPLIARGAVRVRWRVGDAPWTLPLGARPDCEIAIPTAMALDALDGDDEVPTLHARVWQSLFGIDGEALGVIARAGRAGQGALVRAATRALTEGVDEADASALDAEGPPTRAELQALCAAIVSAAPARHGVRAHPHALVMLPARGDPTRGLRAELRAMLDAPAPREGPLGVFLGATPAPPTDGTLWSHGTPAPTPSQRDAARALEGTGDLVAVRGPPGCGKTALLHHLAAQAIVARALDDTWRRAPSRDDPWALLVTSTNNAAVDHALAPFVDAHGLPAGLRLGSLRVLAEVTAPALDRAADALARSEGPSLAEAREAFEAAAAPIRAFERDVATASAARRARAAAREARLARAETLRRKLSRPSLAAPEDMDLARIDACDAALREHEEAADALARIHLDGPRASVARACAKWDEATARRRPRIEPVLAALDLASPLAPLDPAAPRESLARQREAMESARRGLQPYRDGCCAARRRAELAEIERALGAEDALEPIAPQADPSLVARAIALRDAWARAHRPVLLARLREAAALLRGEARPEAGRTAPGTLLALSPLFPIAGCTLLSMRGAIPREAGVIDRLVIDEAGQCAPVYAVPALYRARRAGCTGDTAQLPPVYSLDARIDARLARGLDAARVAPFRMDASSLSSAQAVAEARAARSLALVEHFRSQPEIVALASAWSGYRLDVRTPRRSMAARCRWLDAPVRVIPVRGEGVRAPEGVVNEAEARRAVALVEAMVGDGVAPEDIAVLTPFVGQSARIERALGASGLAGADRVLVRTVHKLQGGERRVVIVSVTATSPRHLRWLAERPHLLHVATSRAQDHLIVLVDPARAGEEPALAPLRRASEDQTAARSRATGGHVTIARDAGNSAK